MSKKFKNFTIFSSRYPHISTHLITLSPDLYLKGLNNLVEKREKLSDKNAPLDFIKGFNPDFNLKIYKSGYFNSVEEARTSIENSEYFQKRNRQKINCEPILMLSPIEPANGHAIFIYGYFDADQLINSDYRPVFKNQTEADSFKNNFKLKLILNNVTQIAYFDNDSEFHDTIEELNQIKKTEEIVQYFEYPEQTYQNRPLYQIVSVDGGRGYSSEHFDPKRLREQVQKALASMHKDHF